MNVVIVAASFLLALLLTLLRGAGFAFALVYLPALLLLSYVPGVSLPRLPDATVSTAAVYGILIGSLALWLSSVPARREMSGRLPATRYAVRSVSRRRSTFRPTAVDYAIGLLFLAYILSATVHGSLWSGINVLGWMGLSRVAPYFIVRSTFRQRDVQRHALRVLVAASLFIALFSAIELRFWPDTYLNLLRSVGLADQHRPGDVLARFGFFRTHASFFHAIDLGVGAALVFSAIAILAWSSRIGLRRIWVFGGLGAALFASLSALSFTSFLGLAAGFVLFFAALNSVQFSRRVLVVAVIVLIAVGFGLATSMARTPAGDTPPDEGVLARSYWMRQLILNRTWEVATTSGPFGLGESGGEQIDLQSGGGVSSGSVDNAYLVIAIKWGWIPLGLWFALPVCLAVCTSSGLRRAQARDDVRAMLAGFSAVIGTMIAMFTVWFGFVYSSLFFVVAALAVNATQPEWRTPVSAMRPRMARSALAAAPGRYGSRYGRAL